MIPLHTFQRRISGDRKISGIQIGFNADSDSKVVQTEVEKLMRQRRHILWGQDDDFMVMNSQEFLSTLTGVTRLLTLLLGAIAAISLLVGGIGIMNIMLVSVTERTREIGVRLAIGAFENDVMIQFLVEAVVLTSLGGVIGITFGLSASYSGLPANERGVCARPEDLHIGIPLFSNGRCRVWLCPGAQGSPSGPYRSPASRITARCLYIPQAARLSTAFTTVPRRTQ